MTAPRRKTEGKKLTSMDGEASLDKEERKGAIQVRDCVRSNLVNKKGLKGSTT